MCLNSKCQNFKETESVIQNEVTQLLKEGKQRCFPKGNWHTNCVQLKINSVKYKHMK